MELTKKILVGSLSCALLFGCHLPINSVKYKVPIMTVTPPGSTTRILLEFRDAVGLQNRIKRILTRSELYIWHVHANPMACEELKYLQRKKVYKIFECIYQRIFKCISAFARENYGSTFTPLKHHNFVPCFLLKRSPKAYRRDKVNFESFSRAFQSRLEMNEDIRRAIEDYSEDRPMFLEKSHRLLDRLESRLERLF